MIAEKALGNAVQSTTRTKISQTWLASQTGPIERSICAADLLARSPLPGEQVPDAGAEVGAAEDRVQRHPDPEDRRADVGRAHADASSAGPRAAGCREPRRRSSPALPAAREPAQDDDRDHAERGVERQRDAEHPPDPLRRRHRLGGAHVAVDDPGLAAHLGHDPAALQRHHRGDPRDRDRPQEPLRLGQVPLAPPDDREPGGEQEEQAARSRPSCRRRGAAW